MSQEGETETGQQGTAGHAQHRIETSEVLACDFVGTKGRASTPLLLGSTDALIDSLSFFSERCWPLTKRQVKQTYQAMADAFFYLLNWGPRFFYQVHFQAC